jgi:hypothetical protein
METRPNTPGFDAPETQIDHEATPPSREPENAECPEPTPIDTPKADSAVFHPFADIFPLLEGEEFDRFVEDIRQNGQRETIVKTPDNRVLDGRNRYRACLAAGVEPRFEITKEPPEKWLDFVISKNVHRRQLTGSQCALAAAKLVTTTHGDNRHTLRLEAVPVITQPQAAKLFGITDRLVRDALTVMKESEELQQLVKDGKVFVGAAADAVRKNPEHVATFIEEVKAGKKPANAKREIETAKESAPVDDSVTVNDSDTDKTNANLAPNAAEELADLMLPRYKPEEISKVISLLQATPLKDVVTALRNGDHVISKGWPGFEPRQPVDTTAHAGGAASQELEKEASRSLQIAISFGEGAAVVDGRAYVFDCDISIGDHNHHFDVPCPIEIGDFLTHAVARHIRRWLDRQKGGSTTPPTISDRTRQGAPAALASKSKITHKPRSRKSHG